MTVAQMEHAVDITLMLKHRLPNRFCTVHADCEYDARCLHVSWPQDMTDEGWLCIPHLHHLI